MKLSDLPYQSLDRIESNRCVYLQGMTVLHWACDRNQLDIVEFLLDLGMSVNFESADKETPLYFAALAENESLIRLLVRKGARVDQALLEDCDDSIKSYIQQCLSAENPN